MSSVSEIILRTQQEPSCMVIMSEEITELQKNILRLILADNRRPNAIASILRRRNFACNQNDIVQALLDLEKRNLVEKLTTKAWTAKENAEDYID
ncbi:MAG: hypothetical protein AM326_11975 [Candidatus Thorarchaeota archaeon SMTZ-45]|nr:MAG: hypothetical protein AM326_11975 [Candidatus Thorarchaeota archaeon SMTZ-45]